MVLKRDSFVKSQKHNKVLKLTKKPLKKKVVQHSYIKRINKSKRNILNVLERVYKINKKGVSEFISIDKLSLLSKGCKQNEIHMFQSNNGVSYLRRDSIICKKYLVDRTYHKSTGALIGFKLIGFNTKTFVSRHIPQSIRKSVLQKYGFKCIWCGSQQKLEVDHKNGRYNDVTDKVDDFQILCKSCNDKKRERCNKCRETGCRYNVQKEISPILYKSPFICGSAKYNEKVGCNGCFLYDIEDFYKNHDKNEKKPNHEINFTIKELPSRNTRKQGRVMLKQRIYIGL
jgi:ICEA Protein